MNSEPPPTSQPVKESDLVIGALAFEHAIDKLSDCLTDDDSAGAFLVLSCFSPAQIVGFVTAFEESSAGKGKIRLQIPRSGVAGFSISDEHLTSMNAVHVRNAKRDGKIFITAETERGSGASLADSKRVDAAEMKSESLARLWVNSLSNRMKAVLMEESKSQLEAMLKGVFSIGRCSTSEAGDYLGEVIDRHRNGETIVRSAGLALPRLGLPLFEDCFSAVSDKKLTQKSQWAEKLRSHWGRACYLDKRDPKQVPLDNDVLQKTLDKISEDENPPLLPDQMAAFDAYIKAGPGRSEHTCRLLFEYDWKFVQNCFERQRKTSRTDFAEKTRLAIVSQSDPAELSDGDEVIVASLRSQARIAGKAPDEYRNFFAKHSSALEEQPKLYRDWEDWIFDSKVSCTDLFSGLYRCLQKAVRFRTPGTEARIVLKGKKQETAASLADKNERACRFFERHYRSLPDLTGGKIVFEKTKVVSYSDEKFQEMLKSRANFKTASKKTTAAALSLQFEVTVFEDLPQQKGSRELSTVPLTWKLPIDSVLGSQGEDFDALRRFQQTSTHKTSLVAALANYEAVGKKGVPPAVSLQDVGGFSENGGRGGRGSFVPAQTKGESLAKEWTKTLKSEASLLGLGTESTALLSARFGEFESRYNAAILDLANDAMATGRVADMAASHTALLEAVMDVGNQHLERRLLKVLCRIGVASLSKVGNRPSLAVTCPWSPLRIEALAARNAQFVETITHILGPEHTAFSDGETGHLFFREQEFQLSHPLYPEIALNWKNHEAEPRIASQGFLGYSLHRPACSNNGNSHGMEDESKAAADTIMGVLEDYLRLQPHEKDNLTVLLYNCDSPGLASELVGRINACNEKSDGDNQITAQILLMHSDGEHLRKIYKDLVIRGVGSNQNAGEASGEFLSRVRVNISAPKDLGKNGRYQPLDIAYCRDLVSKASKPEWCWGNRETVVPEELYPHQWGRRQPIGHGDRKVQMLLTCPAQTEAGWMFLRAVACVCGQEATAAWESGKCPIYARAVDFDTNEVSSIFRETHELANWVVNQDEILDKEQLKAQKNPKIRVIRYIRSATQGRNLVISSNARDTLIRNTLHEKIRALLPSSTSVQEVSSICGRFMEDANEISGGLVLKAARRANNANELIGMVLSKYLVQSEIGGERPVAWCFLDDYAQWLGKKEGAGLADLLVLAPTTLDDGSRCLDVIVTEAKFVTYDGMPDAATKSGKQLSDTLNQIRDALLEEDRSADQNIWLARLSDLLVSQTGVPKGHAKVDLEEWRRSIRAREGSVRIRGYSHILVHGPSDLPVAVSKVVGTKGSRNPSSETGLQEVFGPENVRTLIQHYSANDFAATHHLRSQIGLTDTISTAKAMPFAKRKKKTVDTSKEVVTPSLPSPSTSGGSTQSAEPESKLHSGLVSAGGSISKSVEPSQSSPEAMPPKAHQSVDHGKWVSEMTKKVQTALLSRRMTAKLVSSSQPTLTPNGLLLRFKGTTDLTVDILRSHISEIKTTDGINVLNVMEGVGEVRVMVSRPEREIVSLSAVWDRWQPSYSEKGNTEIVIAVQEYDNSLLHLAPYPQPHTLISGGTGSGKSILIQNLLLGIAATNYPNQAEIAIIDPKRSAQLTPFQKLPHMRSPVISEADEALVFLNGLVDEMNERNKRLENADADDIDEYIDGGNYDMPRLWVVYDEFGDWMSDKDFSKEASPLLNRLSQKSRSSGIYLVIAAQRPDNTITPMILRSNLGNKLALRVADEGTSNIATGVTGLGADKLLGKGHLVALVGHLTEPVYAQIPYVAKAEIKSRVANIQSICAGVQVP